MQTVPEATTPSAPLAASIDAVLAGPERRWSRRATMLFILSVCGGFWAIVVAIALWFFLGR